MHGRVEPLLLQPLGGHRCIAPLCASKREEREHSALLPMPAVCDSPLQQM